MIRMPRSTEKDRARSSISPTVAPKPRAAPSLIFSLRSDQTRLRANTQPLRFAENNKRSLPPTNRSCRISSCRHHDVRSSDVIARRLHGNLAAAADRGPKDFTDLLLTPGVGARTVRALAMVAEVMHGAPCRFTDPARFSVAHGGKDRHPFPVPLKIYDETIKVLKSAVQKAKFGRDEELGALRRLDEQSRKLERHANGPTVANLIAEELDRSHSYGGRSVFGWEPPPADSSDRVGATLGRI